VSAQIIESEGNRGVAVAPWQPIPSASDSTVAHKDDTVLDLGGVFRLLSRRRHWVIFSVALFLALAGTLCSVMAPRYKATAQIELLKQAEGALVSSGQFGVPQAGATQTEDALDFSLSLQTAVSELESDALALRVIKELNLDQTDDFAYLPLIMTPEAKLNRSLPIDQSPARRTYVLRQWSRHLNVQSKAGTRVIEVTFTHRDPAMAAKIVNRLVSDYIDYRYEVRYAAAQRSTEWLNAKLSAAKAQAEESANRFAAASEAMGIYGNPASDHNIVVNRLEQLNAAAAQAHSNRAAKEAVYKLAQSGDPELVTGLAGAGQGQNSSGNVPTLLINLRQQEAELNAQYAEAATKYGPENPKLLQIGNKLQTWRAEVEAETERIVGRTRQEYMAAVSAESEADRALAEVRQTASEAQKMTGAYGIAKNEADSAQALYERLLETTRETPIVAGLRSTDVNILTPAVAPGRPASPIVPLYLAAGMFVGTIVGIAAAFVRDSVDTSLRNPEDIEQVTQLPVLGVIPRAKLHSLRNTRGRKKMPEKRRPHSGMQGLQLSSAIGQITPAIPALSESRSPVMEAFRSVRSSILLSRPDNPRRVFMLTSPQPGEGKSFSALHLAAALAQNGDTVLLVDADLRRETLSQNLKMAFRTGLSTLIAGTSNSGSYRRLVALPGLTFLCAGAAPPNPAELIGSRKMTQLIEEWRQTFDYVVIDSPPILPVTDAALLSHVVDGVVLIARFAVSKQQALSRAIRIMRGVRAEFFGVVVNDMDRRSSEYGYYARKYYARDTTVLDAEREMTATAEEERSRWLNGCQERGSLEWPLH